MLRGVVHDPTARRMDGVAGHAGLLHILLGHAFTRDGLVELALRDHVVAQGLQPCALGDQQADDLPAHHDVVDVGDLGQHPVAVVHHLADDRGGGVEAPEDVGFAAGEVARSNVVLRAETLAIEAWRQLGYADAAQTAESFAANDQFCGKRSPWGRSLRGGRSPRGRSSRGGRDACRPDAGRGRRPRRGRWAAR